MKLPRMWQPLLTHPLKPRGNKNFLGFGGGGGGFYQPVWILTSNLSEVVFKLLFSRKRSNCWRRDVKLKTVQAMYKTKGEKNRPIHVDYNKVWLKILIGFTKCENKLSVKLWKWNSWRMQPKEHRKLCRYHFLVNKLLHFYNSTILKQRVLLQKIMFVKN